MTDAQAPRFCPSCGADETVPGTFCASCGARLSDESRGAEALIGRVIDGRFRVLRLLGTGGMGAVYLAEHAGMGRRVAIKVLRYELREQKDLVKRFRREITAVSRLADAHTVTVFDSGMWRGLAYLVMEYLRGTDLGTTLDTEGRLGLERALRITCQIGSSLAEAHQQGIVHRDLKPENIFLTRSTGGEELVKVLDFGLAKILAEEAQPESFQTQKGTLLGTPWYMAPEQIEGGELGPATDLYAVGALLFRMLTGRQAFEGSTPVQVLESHLKAERPVLDRPEVPAEVVALVGRLLARRPADRPGSALEVVDLLAKFVPGQRRPESVLATAPRGRPVVKLPSSFSTSLAEGTETPTPADSLPPATRDEFARYEHGLSRRWPLWLAVVGGLAGAGAVLAWALTRPEPPPTSEIEPNDDPRTATPLHPEVALRGFLGRRLRAEHSDHDYFLLVPTPGRNQLSAQVSAVPGIDLVLDGFDAEGKLLFRANDSGMGQPESIRVVVEDEPAYLLLREFWVSGQPPSENSTDPYILKITWESAP